MAAKRKTEQWKTGDRAMADVTDQEYPSEGFNGFGSQLLVGDGGSPEDFEAVAFISSITPGDMSTNIIQRTHLRSPGAHHEKVAGLRDSGPFTLEGLWVPTHESQSRAGGGSGSFTNGGLIELWRNRTEANFKIKLSNDAETEWPFRGVVSRFQPGSISGDAVVNFTAEITPLQDSTADLP